MTSNNNLATACNILVSLLNKELEENKDLKEELMKKLNDTIESVGLHGVEPVSDFSISRVSLYKEF